MENILVILVCALALLLWWVVMPLRAVRHDRMLARLATRPCAEPQRWPSVSVIVPAKDEEHTLFEAMQSLLQVDYPALEIVLVNDRSVDRTAAIIDRLVRQDARVRSLHIDSLPDGWLGKINALHQGIRLSRGEWLLCTDADIHFAPRVVKQAIAHCLAQERDFLALFPRLSSSGLLTGVTQTAFGVMLLSMLDFARITNPRSRLAMGVGAFNLMRRDCLDDEEGLHWLRMEAADDVGLALLAKRRGARIELLSGEDMLEVNWYPTFAEMQAGIMQRFVMGANYSLLRYLLNCLVVSLCLLAPLALCLALAQPGVTTWPGLVVYLLPSLILVLGIRNFAVRRELLWGLPVGFVAIAWGMWRSFFTCLRSGGMYWRGHVYPLRELRAAQRVNMDDFLFTRPMAGDPDHQRNMD